MVAGVRHRFPFFARPVFFLVLFLLCYILFIGPFTGYMQSKSFVEKLGYVPTTRTLQLAFADHKELAGEALVLKVLFYFGGLMEHNVGKFELPPDYPAMSRLLHLATRLDPYNMDTYYFAQSTLAWDVGQAELANNLLAYGMKYRTWDWSLPYYIGFNSSYFLKDYKKAAKYYLLAGELSGFSLFSNLAGRYFHEAGQTELALAHLSVMVKGAKNPSLKKIYQTRLEAMQAVRRIEIARDSYRRDCGENPIIIDFLYWQGYLAERPIDPYGGVFYLEADGKVNSTSKFAFRKRQ